LLALFIIILKLEYQENDVSKISIFSIIGFKNNYNIQFIVLVKVVNSCSFLKCALTGWKSLFTVFQSTVAISARGHA